MTVDSLLLPPLLDDDDDDGMDEIITPEVVRELLVDNDEDLYS